MCPGDPMCSSFGYTQNGAPSKMMKESFLYQLHSHRMKPGVVADPNRFQEVYNSRFGKCRVFKILSVSQESKEWVANPANRICDANGSWFCRGQYPPALNKILAEKKDFSQLEDFNKKENDDSEYQKKYFETLHNKMSAPEPTTEPTQKKPWNPKILSSDIIEKMNAKWDDNPTTTYVWKLITDRDAKGLVSLLTEYPELAHIRSSDGRGPMWWAYEVGDERLIRILKKVGVSDTLKDASGRTAISLRKPNSEL
jgi:dolichyl-diphosphooligosaccharide--protein glycosyltransferase